LDNATITSESTLDDGSGTAGTPGTIGPAEKSTDPPPEKEPDKERVLPLSLAY